MAPADRPDLHAVAPTLAWMAGRAGAWFECYFESARDGRLFARAGSTVVGGHHHQQFNYLAAAFDVSYVLLGAAAVFASSVAAFGGRVIARASSAPDLYGQLLAVSPGVASASGAIFLPPAVLTVGGRPLEVGPYLFPDVYFNQSLGFLASDAGAAARLLGTAGGRAPRCVLPSPIDRAAVAAAFGDVAVVDELRDDDDFGLVTLRVAERWKRRAKGLVFGDPPAVLSQVAAHCRASRVAVYAPRTDLSPSEVVFSAYTEQASAIAGDVGRLATEIGNRVVVGRQTGDGDLLAWSKAGVCMQIIDPNRPAFPVVDQVPHPWAASDGVGTPYDDEPDDAELRAWAAQGKVLATLVWHSGEVAHNEAMVALLDLCSWTGLRMGVGVHAQRYETCPQMWELLAIARDRGGVRGLVEPVLHSGGLGVLAEHNCPADALADHCRAAMARIRRVGGDAGAPRGYYAFLDTDLPALSAWRADVYDAIESAGLEYVISSVTPGRNRVVRRTGGCVVINQSCRVVHGASPFVRITTVDDLGTSGHTRPGWMIGTLDAPVISFTPYVWRHGSRFMQIVDRLTDKNGPYVNVTPRVVARYARLLADLNLVAPPRTAEPTQ